MPEFHPASRRALWVEVVIMTCLFWVPALLGGLVGFINPQALPQDLTAELDKIFRYVVRCAVLFYIFHRGREPLGKLGLARLQPVDLLGGAGLFLLNFIFILALLPLEHQLRGTAGTFGSVSPAHVLPWLLEVPAIFLFAFYEELFCRAYLGVRLQELQFSNNTIILASAVVFTLPHIYHGWAPMLGQFIMGVLFSALFLHYRRLWPLAIGHALFNLSIYALASQAVKPH